MTNAEKIVFQDAIVDELWENPHGIALLSPRLGKSRITLEIIKRRKPKKVLWVTPFAELRDTAIPLEFKKWAAMKHLKNTDIICYGTLKNIPNVGAYDLIILDEIQFLTPDNAVHIIASESLDTKILGLTGTMPVHEEKLAMYEYLDLKILKEVTIDEAAEQGIVADYQIIVHEIAPDNTRKDIPAGSKAKPFLTTEYKQLDYMNKTIMRLFYAKANATFLIMKRMRAIYNSPTKTKLAKELIASFDGRVLIFAGSIAQAEELCEHTYHSKTHNLDMNDFLNGRLDKLACVNAGGVGSTYENVQHFLIVQSNSNKRGDVTQKIARSLLKQDGYQAIVHIINLIGTQDDKWVTSALENFDQSKISRTRH